MSNTLQTAPPDAGPRRGLPRWAWVLIGLLTIIAIVAASIAVFASRGRQVIVLPPEPAAPAATASPSVAPSPTVSAPTATIADGCLGGASDLDRAVLTAQQQAPLSAVGAAAFTATVIRWASATPAPPFQAATARQALSRGATTKVRDSLSGQRAASGATATVDFAEGKYYVENFDGVTAIVSYLGNGVATQDGLSLGSGYLAGTVYLDSENGTWHLRDVTAERSLADLQRIGVPYAAGC